MAEEAMSETISGIIFRLASQWNSENNLGNPKQSRALPLDLAQPPSHTDPGGAFDDFADVKPLDRRGPKDREFGTGKKGPRDVISRHLFFASIWVLENGCKDPVTFKGMIDPVTGRGLPSTLAGRQMALEAWYRYRWSPDRGKSPNLGAILGQLLDDD